MKAQSAMAASRIIAILSGIPIVSTLISLLLLDRVGFSWAALDFFTAFWLLITSWYMAQITILDKTLKSYGWNWSDTGYSACVRQDHAARREYELMIPPSFDVQTMSFNDTVKHSAGAPLQSDGQLSRHECRRFSL